MSKVAQRNLSQGSESYHAKANIYERFSQAEDTLGAVAGFLKLLAKGKDVLDLGCGSGKYLPVLVRDAKSYIGVDVSCQQLEIAREKSRELDDAGDVKLLCLPAESLSLASRSVDMIVSAWVLGTIIDERKREAVLGQALRVLRGRGDFYLVENDIGGEFEFIRERYPDTLRTKAYNGWLESKGFRPMKRLKTSFGFASLKEAKDIVRSIWGKQAASRVSNPAIKHNIIIYHYKKR